MRFKRILLLGLIVLIWLFYGRSLLENQQTPMQNIRTCPPFILFAKSVQRENHVNYYFFLAKSFLTPLEVETRPVSQISRHVKPTREKDSRVLSGFVFCVFYGFRRCNKTNPNISWSTWKIIQVLMTCRADRFRRHIRWQLTGVDLICPFTLPDAVNCQTVNKSLNDEYS